jgi:hypothetical protein
MNKIGVILAVLLLLLVINSTYYFLGLAKASLVEWIVFNACAPSSIAYIIGFVIYMITKDRTALYVAILLLFFFGGLGLFLFPWSGYNIIAQVSHTVMVLNIVWVLFGTVRTGDYKAAALGLLMGIMVFAPFINFQQTYAFSHPEAFKRILGIEIGDFQNKYNIESRQQK